MSLFDGYNYLQYFYFCFNSLYSFRMDGYLGLRVIFFLSRCILKVYLQVSWQLATFGSRVKVIESDLIWSFCTLFVQEILTFFWCQSTILKMEKRSKQQQNFGEFCFGKFANCLSFYIFWEPVLFLLEWRISLKSNRL